MIVLSSGAAPEHLARLRVLAPDRIFRKPTNFLDLLTAVRGQADAAAGPAAALAA